MQARIQKKKQRNPPAMAVVYPGFTVGGGANLIRGILTPNMATLKKMCVKMKELGPFWGAPWIRQ